MNMKFKREQILTALKENREEHIEIVKEAQVGFREKLERLLESKLTDVREGRKVDMYIDLTVPENHVDDFDRAIQMLEMCVDETIDLDERTFQCYVRGKWKWERDFLMSNSAYSPKARSKVV